MKLWRLIAVLPLLAATSIVVTYQAQAAEIYSSQWGTSGGFGLNSTYWAAHKFTAGTNATISSIDMYVGGGSITRLVLRSNNANTPGVALETMTSSTTSSTTQTFTGSFTMTAGSTYWLSAEVVSGSANIGVKSAVSDSSSYGWTSGGAIMSSLDYGANWGTTYVGGAIVFILRMNGSASDTTAPTFTSSSSFSVAENITTTSNAATIKVSESATIAISAGADAARFNIVSSDSITAYLRFNSSPNFEVPSVSGSNNLYDLNLSATDAAGNIGTQVITVTVTDMFNTSAFSTLSLSGAVTTAT